MLLFMIGRIVPALLAVVPVCASAQEGPDQERRGKALLIENCSRCHAIEREGASPHPEAPPFRTLGNRYPVDFLAEALAEGLTTGHPDMPQFVFEPDEVGAILAYLRSLQRPESAPRSKR